MAIELIACTDRLPDKGGCYLVFAPMSFPKNSRFVVAEYYEDNGTLYSDSSEYAMPDVTHWAQLPEEPK